MAFGAILILFLGVCRLAYAQTAALSPEEHLGKQIRAVRVDANTFEIDGRLDEAV